jgi:ribosomal protein S18 acetylase RimI-like enzyme
MQIRYIISYAVGLILCGLVLWFGYFDGTKSPIQPYNAVYHREAVLDIFHQNWFWLVAKTQEEARQVGYSPAYRFNYLAPTDRSEDVGKLIVKVYMDEGAVAGFVAYYMKSFYKGVILFLAIDEEHRRKGYARKLLDYAVVDLEERGATVIELLTRLKNERARGLYETLGFKEASRFDKFITYQLDTP